MGDGLESPRLVVDEGTGDALAAYVYSGEHAQMRYRGTEATYYLRDAMGSVIALADGTGTKVATYAYDAFGNQRSATGMDAGLPPETAGDFRFQGMWREPNGTYYVRARQYDPVVGRFLSKDAAEGNPYVPETWGGYAFASGAPTWLRDPTGLFSLSEATVSVRIQQVLSSVAKAGLRQLLDEAKEAALEQVGGMLVGAVYAALLPVATQSPARGLLPRIEGFVSFFKEGLAFENLVIDEACDALPAKEQLYLAVGASQRTGEPRSDGFSCTNRGGRPQSLRDYGALLKNLGRDTSFPDFLFARVKPTRVADEGRYNWSKKSYLIGDVKISVRAALKESNQRMAMIEHADNYSAFPAVLYVTLRGGRRYQEVELRNSGARKGVIVYAHSLF